ncbi:MAG TPA: carboxyltransferase domain-containing protein [Acidimicrobiales bacterium]|nr:carboxyltransferase domain-containing protein [Acidimicrobiales bacterium]
MGDSAVLIEAGSQDDVHRMWRAWRWAAGVRFAVPGARTVLVVAEAAIEDGERFVARLPAPTEATGPAGRTVNIPVLYDGPDLDGVAESCGVSAEEVVARHSGAEHLVGFLGFSPGFAYLTGGDPRVAVSRLPEPRTSVPAGSVALAGGMTAIYPQATPGGWRLIGRTGTVMFDPYADQPARLVPGDRVRFIPVAELPPYAPPSLGTPLAPPTPSVPALEVLDAGPQLTLQDDGRSGWAHAGVPIAGAADRRSARAGHAIVGNHPGAAGLESTLGRFRLRLRGGDAVLAVTGAAADLTVDGLPARSGAPLHLRPGMELLVGPARQGVRMYLAVAGGLDAPVVLGSRSADTLSGLGPAPLRPGDVVAIGTGPASDVGTDRAGGPAPVRPGGIASGPGRGVGPARRTDASGGHLIDDPVVVSARLGPRSDWLHASGRATLGGEEFRVGPASDRIGVRLEGPPVRLSRPGELPSEGMVAGAVQIPPAGRPIVMMRNHPPTGGYPVVAVVDDAGVDALAQAGPGTVVRFRLVD